MGLGAQGPRHHPHGSVAVESKPRLAVGDACSSDPRVHFRVWGPRTGWCGEIEIRWPSGIRQVLRDVRAGQILTVRESGAR